MPVLAQEPGRVLVMAPVTVLVLEPVPGPARVLVLVPVPGQVPRRR